jgi:hypothetical protein
MSLSIAERQLVELRIRNDGPNIAVAYVLWAVLGLPVSAHRFYLGRPRSAIYQIISVFLLIGIFWWLLDAALISGIVRDQKEAMRRDLTRELEEGRETQDAPAPRRFEPDPQPVSVPAASRALEPQTPAAAPAPDAFLTRGRPQPFGLQSLGGAPVVAPPPEPVVQAIEPVAEPIESRPFGLRPVTEAANPPPPRPDIASPRVDPQPLGLRLIAEEPEDRPAGESPFRFHPES